MTVPRFVDTNVPIYAARVKDDEPHKFAIAIDVLRNEPFCLSTQVLQEFYVAAQRTGRRAGVALTEGGFGMGRLA